jgi:signal peptidase
MITAAVTTATAPKATARTAEQARPAKRRGVLGRLWSVFTTLVLVAGVFALLFMTVGPRVLHYRTATMLTGSMVPTINPGDIVLDTQEPSADIAIGQIISYHIPIDDHRVESHRVIWVRHLPGGAVLFRTKGDANTAPDPWTAKVETPTVWRVRTVLPLVGSVIRALRQPIVHLLMAIALPAVLVLMLLVSIWRPSRTGSDDSDAAPKPSARKQGRHRRAAAERVPEMQGAAVGGNDPGAGSQA